MKAGFEEGDRASQTLGIWPSSLQSSISSDAWWVSTLPSANCPGAMRQHDFDSSLVMLPARPWDLEERDLLLVVTLGVALLLLLILCQILACMMIAQNSDAAEERFDWADFDASEVHQCQLCTKVTDADVRAAVDDPFAWGQLLRFAWFVLRPSGNLVLLIHTAAQLPEWQPHKPWDLERHIVVYGEGLVAMLLLVSLLGLSLASNLDAATNYLRLASNFSFLRLLALADPVATWTLVTSILTKSPSMVKLQAMRSWKAFSARVMIYIVACIYIPTLVSFALMAILVKVSEFSFITLGEKWTPPDFVRVLLFVNALAGLRGDGDLQRRNTVLNVFDNGEQAVASRFSRKLAEQMLNSHGRLGGIIAYTTMSTDQVIKMLKQEVQHKD